MSLTEVKKYYPESLHSEGAFLLREYLQYVILELLFQSDYQDRFAFLEGTCLRIVHNNQRFSEDLDFDNFNLSETDFEAVSVLLKNGLLELGYEVEIRNVMRGAYHCYIRFPKLLYEQGLSPHKEAKIAINLDTEPQNFAFEPETLFLNKFDIFTPIKTTPLDLLLSQKFTAITYRKRAKGRDFFDVVFLLGMIKPNYDFLKCKLNVSNPEELKVHVLEVCDKLNFKELAKDVQPFLFQSNDVKKVLYFKEYFKNVDL
jgi:predicted nucleotidyltransferase component of viral defense system